MIRTSQNILQPAPAGNRPKSLFPASSPSRQTPRARVLRWIETSIKSGVFGPGDPIPSERTLAEILGVARNTAAAALDDAERRRIVVRHSPTARKRFVPTTAPEAVISSSTVYVMGAMDPFVDGRPAPRWSDRYLSMDLLSRLSRTGKHVLFLNGDSMSEPDVDGLFQAPPAGMIVANAVSGHRLAMRALVHCREAAVPVVVYGNAPELREFDRVYTDHRAGGRAVVEWLLARGCRRIAPLFPGHPSTHWARERLAGYDEAMHSAGLEPLPLATFGIAGGDTLPLAEQFRVYRAMALSAMVQLQATGPLDAVVCLSDHWAKPVIAALDDLRATTDILVAGYDNTDHDPEFDPFEPAFPNVTIDKHNEKTAEEMAALLVARMEGSLPPGPQCRTHPHELVVRTAP